MSEMRNQVARKVVRDFEGLMDSLVCGVEELLDKVAETQRSVEALTDILTRDPMVFEEEPNANEIDGGNGGGNRQ